MATLTGPVFTQLQAQLAGQAIADPLLTVCNDTVDQLIAEQTQSSKPGMLLGKIQSGKTKAFIGVLAIAFDNGYDHAVIFTKGTKALARQTVARLRQDLRLAIDQDLVTVDDIMTLPDALSPWQLERKLILVCKKEDDNLERLTEVLTQQYPELAAKRFLLIDDEADLASVGYKKTDGVVELNVIPTQISDLRDSLTNASYLMVTATPYALYLQPDEIQAQPNPHVFQPVRPAFTQLVPVHAAYIGGEYYFEQSQVPGTVASFLHVEVDPAELTALKTPNAVNLADVLTSNSIPALRRAVVTFVVGGTIRRWQQQQAGQPSKRYSFLVHTETKNDAHAWQNTLVTAIIDRLRAEAQANIATITPLVTGAYDDLAQSITIAGTPLPPLATVLGLLPGALNGVQPQTVNKESDVDQLLDVNGQLQLRNPMNVFIGGNILDRGITIDNVIGFYYGRNPKKSQQDTVLQHARMYGARAPQDLAVTRFFTTADLYSRMDRIHQFDSALRSAFEYGGQDHGVVFLQSDPVNQIAPCSPNKILLSRIVSLRSSGKLVPAGFSTNANTAASVAAIDAILADANPNPNAATYILPIATVGQVIEQIATSLTPDPDREFEFNALRAALTYLTGQNQTPGEEGQVACLVRRNRNVAKVRLGGRLQNAPAQQQEFVDLQPIRGGRPALILLKVTGQVADGWSGTPFYWPVLSAQAGIRPVIFSAEAD